MAHLIQPITIDGTAHCCKCYGVSEALGRGTEGVLTDNAFALNGGLQTAVGSLGDRHNLTGNCGPWTLLTGSIDLARTNVDIYELWWLEGEMDDTMVYTTGGVDYLANGFNGYPKDLDTGGWCFGCDRFVFDPWRPPAGNVLDRAFRQIDTETVNFGILDGPTLREDVVAGAAAPALNPAVLTIWNVRGDTGGDTDHHYWKQIGTVGSGGYKPEGEISFGVSCGNTVDIDFSSSSAGGSGSNNYFISCKIFVDGVIVPDGLTPGFELQNGVWADATKTITVEGGPCGTIVTLYAQSIDTVSADPTTTVTLTAEVTSITQVP